MDAYLRLERQITAQKISSNSSTTKPHLAKFSLLGHE